MLFFVFSVILKNIDFSGYVQNISRYFRDETSSEMSYRTGFQNMLEQIFPKEDHYHIQHDPKATAGNKPDFIIVRYGVPLLYIEVKKVGENLDKIEKSSQASRYFGYTNLIISDYLSFRFYRNGQKYDEHISLGIAHEKTKEVVSHSEKGEVLVRTIKDFTESQKEPIESGKHLAKIMGGKAQRIRENTVAYLEMETAENTELKKMMEVIKESLVSDLDIAKFADLYAQTLVYGLFVARYNDPTLDNFSRQEARDLIPKSNPFLQHFFDHIAGVNFPKRLDIIVSELCEVFTHADVHSLMEEYFGQQSLFGDSEEKPDPVIHFYEDFLREYDQTKKMEMGVFYTPRSVVHFIIRSVDLLLKKEFDIAKGLADNQKIWQEVEDFDAKKNKRVKIKKEFHKVQILDVATGTGTFLNEIIQFIAKTFEGREGVWKSYAETDLIPRLLGFELMMAPYTIAHLKLGMTLEKTGIKNSEKRLNIYLTNTLDEAKSHSDQIQMNFIGIQEVIAEESHSASKIKSERPVMVVVGNPPYSGESMNAHYTENNVYKVEPGGKQKLQERNSKWINDDYVKFIRFAESLIEKNGEGIVGMITAHGYIDNPTFRGMRWHLRKTFDKIYVLDLHGNANKKETTPEGEKDENVFDIKTGVSILLGVKKKGETKKKELATVHHADFFGLRREKQEKLDGNNVESIQWKELPADCETWIVEEEGKNGYEKGFSVNDLFIVSGVGVVTARDSYVINEDETILLRNAQKFRDNISSTQEQLCSETGISNKKGWNALVARKMLQKEDDLDSFIREISYRPFDTKKIFYHPALIWRTVDKIMQHLLNGENICLLVKRQSKQDFSYVFLTNTIAESCMFESTYANNTVCPLYLYFDDGTKQPNLDIKIWKKINAEVGETTPENILDYVYAVLHSPKYREKYKAFLKTDFPRVPYPSDLFPPDKGDARGLFWNLVPLGTKLRKLHLLEDPLVKNPITTFPISGSNEVEKITFQEGRVFFNATQYFGNVPETAWNFFIGGYQPAQKFLKDRKGKILSHADIERYEEMIVALSETEKVMKEVDDLIFFEQ